jgi:uncharacterized membrane protein YsdA (DUF1294 family)/cold shock CspA family protein
MLTCESRASWSASYLTREHHPPTTMRYKGKLKSWNDDRGFGFIHPIHGGEEIFVHIKAFSRRSSRPQMNELLWFEIEVGPEGKKRARNVEYVRQTPNHGNLKQPPVQRGTRTLVAIPCFVFVYVVIEIVWQPPLVLAAVYLGASIVTFLVYAKDKLAAQRNGWRTAETTLHLLAFAGGWPGALCAQQLLRHKTTKPEFRACFWTTVIMNVAGFVLLCSPAGQSLWATILM